MKNLIIISDLSKEDFGLIPNLKSHIDQSIIDTWSNLPFLRRTIIITKDAESAENLFDFVQRNKLSYGLEDARITLKENLLQDAKMDLKVDTKIDMHYENKLSRSPSFTDVSLIQSKLINGQLPSPTVTVEEFGN